MAQASPKAGHHQILRIGRARTQPEGQTLGGETNRLALTEKHADTDFVSELFAERLAGPKLWPYEGPWRANAVKSQSP